MAVFIDDADPNNLHPVDKWLVGSRLALNHGGGKRSMTPLGIKGVVWYQGERNATHPDECLGRGISHSSMSRSRTMGPRKPILRKTAAGAMSGGPEAYLE